MGLNHSQNKSNIVLDIDSVISDTETVLINYLQDKWDLYLDIEDFINFDFSKNYWFEGHVCEDICKMVGRDDLARLCRPYSFSKLSMENLSKDFNIYVVSARPDSMNELTREWFDTYELPYIDIFTMGTGDAKVNKIIEIEPVAYVEDRFREISLFLRREKDFECQVYCVDKQWNRRYYSRLVTRVESLKDAADHIRRNYE